MDAHTVIDTFFSFWVMGLNGDGFGMPSNYVYTSSGRKLDTKEGKELCEELELTWKYPKLGKVIAHNSKIRRDTRKQSQPPPIDDKGELTHSVHK